FQIRHNAPEALRSVLHFAKPSDVRSPWKGLGRQSLRGDVTEARRDFVTSFRGYAPGGAFYFYGSSEKGISRIRNLSTEDGFPAWRIAVVVWRFFSFL